MTVYYTLLGIGVAAILGGLGMGAYALVDLGYLRDWRRARRLRRLRTGKLPPATHRQLERAARANRLEVRCLCGQPGCDHQVRLPIALDDGDRNLTVALPRSWVGQRRGDDEGER